ncbi:MAG TPA: RDD family protein [Dissulfurispiraceae bacterium]|nr:RDD family protein [Dissulfurispiraceae bacterium]
MRLLIEKFKCETDLVDMKQLQKNQTEPGYGMKWKCRKCGNENSKAASKCFFCGKVQRVVFAGFWNRTAAFIIDFIILILAASISIYAFNSKGIFNDLVLGMMLPWAYFSLMESSDGRATLGKMALGITVTDLNGKRISQGKATIRFFAKYLSALILFAGFIMVRFTKKKQALHDIIAGTLVVLKRDR